ncbi:ABC transporter substrate-binding protein [Actinomyces sp.]|uniref:ABC transporter substrate-binding protein n=1 Tax=Actinomyces sp. TaxID=29317 RepID=UPI0026DB8E91|nr:extracellular solute-binding protein [Actinomyces sp.]MDO4899473.1 extracellular solute-binding protein [Actinomyces sp.]
MQTPIPRRALLGLGAAAAMAVGGCSTASNRTDTAGTIAPASGPLTLTYWSWLKDLQTVADLYSRVNPNVKVEVTWIPSSTSGGYQKLYSALAAGGGPDIGQVEMRMVPEFVLAGDLVDISRYGARDHQDRFDPAAWSYVDLADGVYGIPQDTGPVALFYRTDVFDEVGAPPPTTWQEWAETARLIQEYRPGTYMDVFNVADGNMFATLCQQAGGNWFVPEGEEWVINLTDEACLKVAGFWDTAIDDGLVNTAFGSFSSPWMSAMGAGALATHTNGSWADALIEAVPGGSGKFKVAPMPRWESGYGSSYSGGSTAAVMANSQHPQEATDFIVWMHSDPDALDSLITNCGTGWSPAADYIGKVREGPSEFFSGQSYNTEVIAPMAREQNLDWLWPPLCQQSINIVADGMRRKLTDGTSLVDSLSNSQAEIVQAFQRRGLRAREAEQ